MWITFKKPGFGERSNSQKGTGRKWVSKGKCEQGSHRVLLGWSRHGVVTT